MPNETEELTQYDLNHTVIKEIYLNKDFLKKFFNHYLTKLKEYSDKHTLVNYLDFTDDICDTFNIIILDKNNWLILGPFVAFTYNNITKELLDLNQLVKEKYEFTDDVYLNFNSSEYKSICNALLQSLDSNKFDTILCYDTEDNNEFLNHTLSNQEVYDLYCDFKEEKAKIFIGSISKDYREYEKYKRSEYNKLDINSRNAKFFSKTDFFSPNNVFKVYNTHLLLEDKKEIVKNNKGKTILLPLTYFNITKEEEIESALIFINPINNRIIFPNKDKVKQMIKNNLLLSGNNIDVDTLYKEKKANTNRLKQSINDSFNIDPETLTFKDCIGFLNNQVIGTIKKERETYGEFKFINPFYLSHLISPVIYGVTGTYCLGTNYNNTISDFYNLPSIYSATFNLNILQKFFDPNKYIEKESISIYPHAYTNLNSIFLIDNIDNLKYIDNIHISYLPYNSELAIQNEVGGKRCTQGVLITPQFSSLTTLINLVHSPDIDNIYQLTDKAEICKLNSNSYIINDLKTKLQWRLNPFNYNNTSTAHLMQYNYYNTLYNNNPASLPTNLTL